MNVLNVIYKDTTVNINHSTINIYEDYIQIFFVRTQDNDCKFFCQWLDANRIDYEKKERDSYTIIKVDTNIFNLDITVKFPIKSSEIYNNLYKAIYEHKRDIPNAEAIIANTKHMLPIRLMKLTLLVFENILANITNLSIILC